MSVRRTLRIGLIAGDGIGKEVIPAGRRLLEALPASLGLRFDFVDLDAGFETFERTGVALPEATLTALRDGCDGALFGAVSSPSKAVPGYSSPIVALRKHLDLYANVRPVWSVHRRHAVDLVIVRENTECLYVKEERTFDAEDGSGRVAEAVRRISERASRRIAAMAGKLAARRQQARNNGRQSIHSSALVTVAHKSNVLSQTDGLFRTAARAELAENFPNVAVDEQIIDSLFYKMYKTPGIYDVIVAPNLYGDLLSDGAAALSGGLGLVPGANVGERFVMGEPCHGSAPDIAGKGMANPIGTLRSAVLMLEFLNEDKAAARLHKAIEDNVRMGRVRTPDTKGTATTEEVTEDILQRL